MHLYQPITLRTESLQSFLDTAFPFPFVFLGKTEAILFVGYQPINEWAARRSNHFLLVRLILNTNHLQH